MSWKLDPSEQMSPELEEYFRKMVVQFVRVTEEIGLERTLQLVLKQLKEDIVLRETNLKEATQAFTNTHELIKRLENAS